MLFLLDFYDDISWDDIIYAKNNEDIHNKLYIIYNNLCKKYDIFEIIILQEP